MAISNGTPVLVIPDDEDAPAANELATVYTGTPTSNYPNDDFTQAPAASGNWTNISNISHNAVSKYVYPTGGGIGYMQWADVPNASPGTQLQITFDLQMYAADPMGMGAETSQFRFAMYRRETDCVLIVWDDEGAACAYPISGVGIANNEHCFIIPDDEDAPAAYQLAEAQYAWGVSLYAETQFNGPDPGEYDSRLRLTTDFQGTVQDTDTGSWQYQQAQWRGDLVITITDSQLDATMSCSNPAGYNLAVQHVADSSGRYVQYDFTLRDSASAYCYDVDKTGTS